MIQRLNATIRRRRKAIAYSFPRYCRPADGSFSIYPLHPACAAIPWMCEADFLALVQDIKENGLRERIVWLDGEILDGKNRMAACELAGVTPRSVEWHGKGSPISWVISTNLARRHLTASQRAVIAYDLLPEIERDAKQRQRLSRGRGKKVSKKLDTISEKGAATKIAARIAKTNSAYVQVVKAVAGQAPDLLDSIRAGYLKVPDAAKLAKQPKKVRRNVLRRLEEAGPDSKLKRVMREAQLDVLQNAARKSSVNGKAACHSDGNVEIICGDCLQVMPTRIGDKSVRVAVTSPPYNLGVRYFSYADNLPLEKYLAWLNQVFAEIKRVLSDDGSFFLNIGSSREEPWNAMRVAEVAGRHFVLQNEIVWVKSITVQGQSYGHFRQLGGDRFVNHCFESVYHFTKTGNVKLDRLAVGVPFQDKANLDRNSAPGDIRCGGDVWFIPYETVQGSGDRGHHPATFPLELPLRCIKLAGVREGMVVVDPFVGTGTTLAACRELGVHGIGIEVDPVCCQVAKESLGLK